MWVPQARQLLAACSFGRVSESLKAVELFIELIITLHFRSWLVSMVAVAGVVCQGGVVVGLERLGRSLPILLITL